MAISSNSRSSSIGVEAKLAPRTNSSSVLLQRTPKSLCFAIFVVYNTFLFSKRSMLTQVFNWKHIRSAFVKSSCLPQKPPPGARWASPTLHTIPATLVLRPRPRNKELHSTVRAPGRRSGTKALPETGDREDGRMGGQGRRPHCNTGHLPERQPQLHVLSHHRVGVSR